MQKLAKIQHGGKTHTIALFDDLQVDELNVLLATVFNIQGKILGFLDQVSTCYVSNIYLLLDLSMVCPSSCINYPT